MSAHIRKGGDPVPITESKRKSNDRWDAANMAYQTVKVRRELLDEFRELVQANGDKVNTVLRQAMERYIEEHKTE
jgi:uncharacterized protein (DUF4415 family)